MNLFRNIKKIFIPQKLDLKSSVDDIINEYDDSEGESTGEQELLRNMLGFIDSKVSEVMIPRTEIIGADVATPTQKLYEIFVESGHARIPIYRKSLDDVIGFVHVKDLIPYLCKKDKQFDINKELREIIYAPRSMRVIDLLKKMKENLTHIAIVLDEYGGTDGLATIEDLIEKITGEIRDEHDVEMDADFIVKDDSGFIVDARTNVSDLEKEMKISFPESEGDYETIGGFLLAFLGKIPEKGEKILHPIGLSFQILDADARRIHKVHVDFQKK